MIDINEWCKAFGNYNSLLDPDEDKISNGEGFFGKKFRKDNNFKSRDKIENNRKILREWETSGDIFVINTTNGTKVLEKIKNRNEKIKVLVGASINARKLAMKSLEMADHEIELIMAGRHEKFNIEDCVGAGLIVNEIIKIAHERNIEIEK